MSEMIDCGCGKLRHKKMVRVRCWDCSVDRTPESFEIFRLKREIKFWRDEVDRLRKELNIEPDESLAVDALILSAIARIDPRTSHE